MFGYDNPELRYHCFSRTTPYHATIPVVYPEQNYHYRADKSTIFGMRGLEYLNFNPKHGFLSSVEAEIISFCQRRQPFAFSAIYVHPLIFEGGSPFEFDK